MMNRYLFGKNRIFTGRVIEVDEFDTFPPRSTDIAPPKLTDGEYAKFNGLSWDVVNERPVTPVRVPDAIGLKNFKLALLDSDLLDTVTAHVAGLPVNVRKRIQIELDNGGDITLEQAKTLLGGVINDNVIEQLFIDGQ